MCRLTCFGAVKETGPYLRDAQRLDPISCRLTLGLLPLEWLRPGLPRLRVGLRGRRRALDEEALFQDLVPLLRRSAAAAAGLADLVVDLTLMSGRGGLPERTR